MNKQKMEGNVRRTLSGEEGFRRREGIFQTNFQMISSKAKRNTLDRTEENSDGGLVGCDVMWNCR